MAVGANLAGGQHYPATLPDCFAICVSFEAAKDFASASDKDQGEAYRRVAAFLSAKLVTFDPQHDVPKYEVPPVEQWVISSAVVIG